ncbi:MAG TPA: HYR domain-containing protein, partial [Chitinophagaceae bacterium]|nr:HYR domain-containing protein [Chitinophagaceae bacterium]
SICGTATCTFTITVNDTQPPTITCPANVTVNNTPGLCSGVATYPLPTATDNCPFSGTVPLSITQNSSNTVVAGSVSCNAGGLHTDNSYWRAYDLGPMALSGPFTINSVTFGIELANAAGTGTTQPVTVRIHTSAGAFPGGVRTLVASQTYNIPDQTLSLYTATLTSPPTVPANAILVLEIFTPDGQVAGHSFFIGSNALPETAPSYLSAAACGAPNPVTVASLGFPNMHTIINAAGLVSNPSGSITQIAGLPSGSAFPVGVTTNTFRVTDVAGNTATCSFTVTVVDNQAPAVTCPTNIVANTDAGVCIATVATPNPTTSDNCAVTQVTWAMTGATTGSSPATGINYVGTRAFNLNGTTGSGVTTITYTVKDAAGNTTTCSFTVTVNDASIPVISGQPTNQFVCVGSDGAFTVTATAGAGNPLTYQWQAWNGTAWVNITGATAATLPLPAVVFSMNTNSYRVILTGRCSVVTSAFATLYVNQLPTVSILASGPLALLPAQTLTLTAVANPGGGTYQWFKNGVAIPGATGPSLNNLTVDNIGIYTVRYTDLNGCVATSAAMTVTGEPSCKLWVYPNPNQGLFQVRFFNSVNEAVTVNVYNSGGSRIYSKAVTTGLAYSLIDVDIQSQPAGVYTVEVVNAAGKRACNAQEKFIKVL